MTQTQSILRYLRKGNSLTPLKALRLFGVMALSQRVTDLLRAGHPIKRARKKVGNKSVGLYSYGR